MSYHNDNKRQKTAFWDWELIGILIASTLVSGFVLIYVLPPLTNYIVSLMEQSLKTSTIESQHYGTTTSNPRP